jgi:nucleoside-diphosphate-sugar epimerase
MHILVTGGAGFIGSHLVRWLVEQQHRVRVIDNLSSGKLEWLGSARSAVDFVKADIGDFAAMQAVSQHIDLVVHLAALVSVVESTEHPLRAYATNTSGTLHVFEAARLQGVRRVVHMSSSAVYGDTETLPVPESEPASPLSPYAASKLAAEQAGQLYTRLYGLETVALRGFNIYGPRQSPTSPYAAVVPRFIDALRQGRQPTIFGDGLQTRDFIYVGDLVQALWAAATAPGIAGEVLNAGSGAAWSVLDLAHTLGQVLGVSVEPQHVPPRSGEVRHSCADVSRLAERAGFRAPTRLREGLAATVAAWDAH